MRHISCLLRSLYYWKWNRGLEKGLSVEDVSRSLFKMWEFFLMVPLKNGKSNLRNFFDSKLDTRVSDWGIWDAFEKL
jgi:hypothetical protein